MRLAILALLWLGAATWLWDRAVPLVPTHLAALEDREGPYFLPAAGEFMTTQRAPQDDRAGSQHGVGPIEFRDIHTGEVRREQFDATVVLKAWDLEKRDRIVIEQDGRIRLARLSTGETICEVPEAAGTSRFMFAAEGQVLLAEMNDGVSGFDPATGQRLWSREDIKIARYIQNTGPRYAPLLGHPMNRPADRSFTRVELVDWRTGQPAPVIGMLPNVHRAIGTRDGRFMAVHETASFKCTMYDAGTGAALWTKEGSIPEVARFNEDGTELQIPYQHPDGTLGLARWATANGAEIAPIPVSNLPSNSVFSADGRLAVDHRMHWKVPVWLWAQAVHRNWQRLAAAFGPESRLCVIDVATGGEIGSLHPDENLHMAVDDGKGFVTRRNSAVVYYTFPPKRDWMWLFKWGVVPPLTLWGAVRALRSIRRMRQPSSAFESAPQDKPSVDPNLK